MFKITEAKREQLIGAIAFIGPSGSGKTLSALKTAKGMMDKKYGDKLNDEEKWRKIGMIDTEHERSKIYAGTSKFGADIKSFIHLDFQKPFTVERLDQAMKALKDYGCEVIITDSISHFWEGDDGLLDLQQKFGGNFQAWREVNPHYNHFISLVTGEKYEIDMLNCIRAKQKYEVSQNEAGKLKVEKLGLQPVQRDSLEYEFQIVFNIDMNHVATALKDNSGMFEQYPQVIQTEAGEQIYAWLKEGVDVFAERRERERKEKEEIKSMINTIMAYTQSSDENLAKYAQNAVGIMEKKYGPLEKLSLDTLKRMLEKISEHHKMLQERQGNEEEVLKGLREVAKSFKIKGYTKMSKEELEEAIKKAQA